MTVRSFLVALTLAAAALPPRIALAQEPGEVLQRYEEHVVVKGDTLRSLAAKFYDDAKLWKRITWHNDGISADADLKVGATIKVPIYGPGADAELTATQRRVQTRPPSRPEWDPGKVGQDLFRNWRVNTLEQSSAEVTFRDTSRLSLRENTLVIIYGASSRRSRKEVTEARLENGSLRTRLGELAGGKKVEVTTPHASATLEGGEALVSVDGEGTSRVANHGSGAAFLAAVGIVMKIAPNMGSKAKRGRKPTKPKPLPPSPTWAADQPTRFVGVDGFAGSLAASWAPVKEAKYYGVEVARSQDGTQVVAAVRVPATTTRFEAHALPPGDYYARVAAIDDDAFESIPSKPIKLTVASAGLVQPTGAAPTFPDVDQLDPRRDAPAPAVLPGTELRAPQGLKCGVGDAPPAPTVVLLEPGRTDVRCEDESGAKVPGFTVEVTSVHLTTNEDGRAWPLELVEGQETDHTIHLAPDASMALDDSVGLQVPEGIRVVSVTKVDDETWTVRIAAEGYASHRGVASLTLGDPPHPIAEIPFLVTSPEAEAVSPATEKERNMIEIGALGGVLVPSDRHALFQSGVAEHSPLGPTGVVGLRVAYHPIRWVGVELENAFMAGRTDAGGARFFSLGGHVVGQLPYRVTPLVTLGGGATIISSPAGVLGRDVDAELHFGTGVKFHATRMLSVRVDLRDYVMPGLEESLTHNLRVTAGIGVVFGRRSVGALRQGARGE